MKPFLPLLCLLSLSSPAWSSQVVGGGWMEDHNFAASSLGSTAVTSPGDIDGDAEADFLMTTLDPYNYGTNVSLRSSSGNRVLWDRWITNIGAVQAAAAAGDLDGDGVPDILLGAQDAFQLSTWQFDVGTVILLSGSDGSIIDSIWGDHAADHFGTSVASLGDIDGDLVPDFLVGAMGEGSLAIPEGAVYIYSGADRRRILTVAGPAFGAAFGWAAAPLADWDGDRKADFVVGAPGHLWERGRISIHSSATGAVIHEMVGSTAGGRLGHALHSGAPTLHPNTFLASAPLDGPGRVIAIDSQFRVMWQIEGQDPAEAYGTSLVMSSDLNGDRDWDLLIGRSPRQRLDFLSALEIRRGGWLPGAKPLWTLAQDPPQWAAKDSTVDLGDWNGDRLSEFASSALSFEDAWSYAYAPFLHTTKDSISASAGGGYRYDLDFLPEEADQRYAMLLSLAGTGPSELLGLTIPLTVDRLFLDCLAGNAPGALDSPYGRLDQWGDARVIVRMAPGAWTPLIGRMIHAAAVTYDNLAEPRLSSAMVPILVLP